MTAFRFEAARADGRTVRGRLDAPSRGEAAATLSARGLFPVVVEPARERSEVIPWGRRPSVRAKAIVMQSLATLVDAGVPLDRALAATEGVAPVMLRDAVRRVATRVREGASLGHSMGQEGPLFSGATVGLVRAGERGVGLAPALLRAASQLEREAELIGRIRAALAYPILLAVVGTLSVSLIVFFVVPRFAAILGDLGQALPPATRALILLSDLARTYGPFAAVAGVALAGVAGAALQRHRVAWHEALLGLPVLGPLRHGLATGRVARTLGALLGTGTPALAALAIAREAAGDAAIAARLTAAGERVGEGVGLTAALREARAFTDGALQLAQIGEGSGRLADLLVKAAEVEERLAERRIQSLVGFLEPAMIIAFAAGVAFVAAALLQAVYSVRPA